MPSYGVATGKARTPGIRHQYRFNNLWINRRGVVLPLIGQVASFSELDIFRLTQVSGFSDGDVRDTRELLSGIDGETSLITLAGGRTIVLEGFIETGSIPRLEDMWMALREAFFPRIDLPLQVHDPRQDIFDDYSSNTIADYTLDAGSGTLSISGGQLIPSSTAAKRVRHTGRATSYLSGVVTRRIVTGTTVAAGVWRNGLRMDVAGTDTGLFATLSDADPGLRVQKVVAGTVTDLATIAFNPSTSTSYWLRLILNGDDLTAEIWNQDPIPGTPTSARLATTAVYTLTDAEQTAFAAAGHAGWRDTPAATSERYDDFRVEDWTSDVVVNCRKSATLPGVDQQSDGRYRRPFQVTLRAPSVDMLSTYESASFKVMAAAAPTGFFENYATDGYNPLAAGTGKFTDVSSTWSVSDPNVVNARAVSGVLKLNTGLVPALAVLASDPFDGVAGAATVLNGRVAPLGGTWASAGDAPDFQGAFVDSGFFRRAGVSVGVATARIATLGSTNYGETYAVSCHVSGPYAGAGSGQTLMGVRMRQVNSTNYVELRRVLTWQGGGFAVEQLSILVLVANAVVAVQTVDLLAPDQGIQDFTLRLVVNGDHAYGEAISSYGVETVAVKHSSLAVGGALQTGLPAIVHSTTSGSSHEIKFDDFKVESVVQTHLRGQMQHFDQIAAAAPDVGDATHTIDVQPKMTGASTFTNVHSDFGATGIPDQTKPALYVILKAIPGAPNKMIALKLSAISGIQRPGFTSSTPHTVRMQFAKIEGTTETLLGSEVTLYSNIFYDEIGFPLPSGNVDPPLFHLTITVAGNVLTANCQVGTDTPLVVAHTLTAGDITAYGAAIQGKVGLRFSQVREATSRPRIDWVDNYRVTEATGTPQTMTAINVGNVEAHTIVQLLGPFDAGAYIAGIGPNNELIGPLLLQKILPAGKELTVDSRTGLARDETGALAGSFVADDSKDIKLPPGGSTFFEMFGNSWLVGTSRMKVRHKESWR